MTKEQCPICLSWVDNKKGTAPFPIKYMRPRAPVTAETRVCEACSRCAAACHCTRRRCWPSDWRLEANGNAYLERAAPTKRQTADQSVVATAASTCGKKRKPADPNAGFPPRVLRPRGANRATRGPGVATVIHAL